MLSKIISRVFILALIILSTNSINNFSYAEVNDNKIEKSNDIKWFPYDYGIKEAKRKNKKALVVFYTDWCSYCKKLDGSFENSEIQQTVNKNFIGIKVNCESNNLIEYEGKKITESDFSKRLQVYGYPTTIIFDSENKFIERINGYLNVKELKTLFTFLEKGDYKNKSFYEFASQNK
ncbi:MAG: thioredoxin family protein [Candidatus Sericytochromatia bacterium]